MKAYVLKAEIRKTGCELNRIGRSRNWQLIGFKEQFEKIIIFINGSDEQSWHWLAKKLSEHVNYSTTSSLIDLVRKNPNITVNELMAKTDCTIAQARKAIDQLEWQED